MLILTKYVYMMSMEKLKDITIVVPTKNEPHNIPAFLRSIPPKIPLIVVDASDDNTVRLIQAIGRNGRLLTHRRKDE